MILPIRRYGDPVLRQETQPIMKNTPKLQQLIDDMIETMHQADGIGLAAPQIGESIRLFVADVSHFEETFEEETGEPFPENWRTPIAFINPEIIDESDDEVDFEEGCLSVPDIREMITRPAGIRVKFLDRNFDVHEWDVSRIMARVFQHEFDHIEGVLFLDHLSSFKRRMLQRKLRDIQRGEIETPYLMA